MSIPPYAANTRPARLIQEREHIAALSARRFDQRRVERDLLQRVNEWRDGARRKVAQGRQVIRKLLGERRVQMMPWDDGTVELSGRADYGKLFSGLDATAMASLMPASWNQIASCLKQIDSLRQAA